MEKNKFSFASSDHLEIASVLGMGACVCFSFQLKDSVWYRPVHAASVSMSSYTHWSFCVKKACVLKTNPKDVFYLRKSLKVRSNAH